MKQSGKPKKKQSQGRKKRATSRSDYDELAKLREMRKQQADRAKRKEMAVRHTQVMREFRQWKEDLKVLVDTRAKIEVLPSGEAKFILPAELVKLVWLTTIKQRIAVEAARKPDGAFDRAMESIRSDLTTAAQNFAIAKGEETHAGEGRRVDESDGGGGPKAG